VTSTPSSGNVFADLGFDNPEEMRAKSEMVIVIAKGIERLGLTQVAAAEMMGIDQPSLSKLLRGRTLNFTLDRLSNMLRSLGTDVTIVLEEPSAPPGDLTKRGHVRVRTIKAGSSLL